LSLDAISDNCDNLACTFASVGELDCDGCVMAEDLVTVLACVNESDSGGIACGFLCKKLSGIDIVFVPTNSGNDFGSCEE
jgi:hypothetical protein